MSQESNIHDTPYELQIKACDFCGSSDYDILFERKDLNTNLPGLFTIVKCRNCGLLFLNPMPSRKSILEDIYPDEYDQYHFETTNHPIRDSLQNYGFRKRMRYISKFKKSGRLLDVGCATGDFLKYTQDHLHAWEIAGLEPVSEAANIASERLGIQIEKGFLSTSQFDADSFDVITFWHVFEHLEDPMKSLIETHRLLKDDGIVVITLPITDSLDHKIYKKFWIGYELPRHLYFYSKAKLVEYLEKVGFQLIDFRNLYGSHAMTMTSIKFLLRGKFNLSPTKAEKVFNILMSPISRVFFLPFFTILDFLKLSTPMTFVAQKIK